MCCSCLCVCLRLCTRKKKKQGEKKSVKMSDAETFESNFLPVFVSENSLNYESAAAQSRLTSQANLNQTKPGLDLLCSTCFVL